MMAVDVPLTKGMVALVDEEDLPVVSGIRWHAAFNHRGVPYARGGRVYMHRVIAKAPPGLQVDHINGNTLDNRRANLRLCDNSQNQCNTRLRSDNTSGFRGVRPMKGKWRADLRSKGKKVFLGYFDSPEEAAVAYDAAAVAYFGAFARPNRAGAPETPAPPAPKEGE